MRLFFKHMAFRTWITAGTGIPLSFIVMPQIRHMIPQASPPLVYTLLICIVFVLAGGGMHFTAQQFIKGFIRQAQKWEQEKKLTQCEAALMKGLTAYNSGSLIPWRKKKTEKKLTNAMALFALVHDRPAPLFIKATTHFLKLCPHETEIAAQWLNKETFYAPHDPADARLLTLLARTHKNNTPLLPLLVRRFVASHRSDFEARTLYTTCHEAHALSASMHQKILTLIPDIFADDDS